MHWKKRFWDFQKNGWIQIKIKRKKTTFGTKYLKTHVHMVFLKTVFPHPQLDIKFLIPIRVLVLFFIFVLSKYISYLYTHKIWRTLKDTFVHRPVRPVPSNSRASRARCVGAESLDPGGTLWLLGHSNVPSDPHN